MNKDKLLAIRDMLLHDEHTRRHWLFWTVYSVVDAYIRQWYEMRNLEPPCGAVGCAIGHAHRMGIVTTDSFHDARHQLDMDQDDYNYIFENGQCNRDNDTPEDVVTRIDKVIERAVECAPDGAMEVTDA